MAYPQTSFIHTSLTPDTLLGQRRQAVSANTLQYQLDVLKKTGRYDAFKLKWHPVYDRAPEVWPIPDHLFWDSDVAKWIEGACYFLQQQSMPAIAKAVDELVDMIRSAQQPDGYLNIHYTVVDPGNRFTNLKDMHELYNCGHLIEAALAHQALCRNNQLLSPICSYVDLLCKVFGPGPDQTHGYPGHPEIELALLRLYERTKTERYLSLAKYFITERGNATGCDGRHYFDVEAKKRGADPNMMPAFYPEPRSLWYHQAHKPIAEQTTIEGHSVRAMYLLTSVADLLRLEQGHHDLEAATYRLWNNMVNQKMYSTGGIGAMKQWEGFGLDYFLPQGTSEGGCYSETCAAIGVMMLAQRMLQIDLDRKFADIMELCLYNAVLTAMSTDGKKFTYVNQLASSDKDLSRRDDWFTVACCPPNMLRLLATIGGYIWTYNAMVEYRSAHIDVHLYVGAKLTFDCGSDIVELQQETHWPSSGDVKFSLRSKSAKVDIRLRIPGWAESWKITPECPDAEMKKGYLRIRSNWLEKNPDFTLSIPLKPRLLLSHPLTNQNTLTIARGPVVYCVEDVDNAWVEDHFESVLLSAECKITEEEVHDPNSGISYVALNVTKGASILDTQAFEETPFLTNDKLSKRKPLQELKFVPYYFRANRGGKGHMRVGLKKTD
ncbi:DUF1680-domain-containing protein [Aureobasidium pullulans]|uniref:DUF1680-domain-containing protein n=1 Tax=Aureobasidium pullulans TaxID=5580 RepID=A0A4S9A8Q9_AURPU|nr:DUF1680-domain-containing protein [Aureobasidium pullulans]